MLAVIAAIIRSLSLSFTRRPHFDAGGKNSFQRSTHFSRTAARCHDLKKGGL
jgi:hypothetical protein